MVAPAITNSMETMLQLMMTKMNEGFENLYQNLERVNTKIGDILQNQAKISENLAKMSEKLDMFRDETNERLFRAQLARKHGEDFANHFNMQGMHGLERLVITKKVYKYGYNAGAMLN